MIRRAPKLLQRVAGTVLVVFAVCPFVGCASHRPHVSAWAADLQYLGYDLPHRYTIETRAGTMFLGVRSSGLADLLIVGGGATTVSFSSESLIASQCDEHGEFEVGRFIRHWPDTADTLLSLPPDARSTAPGIATTVLFPGGFIEISPASHPYGDQCRDGNSSIRAVLFDGGVRQRAEMSVGWWEVSVGRNEATLRFDSRRSGEREQMVFSWSDTQRRGPQQPVQESVSDEGAQWQTHWSNSCEDLGESHSCAFVDSLTARHVPRDLWIADTGPTSTVAHVSGWDGEVREVSFQSVTVNDIGLPTHFVLCDFTLVMPRHNIDERCSVHTVRWRPIATLPFP